MRRTRSRIGSKEAAFLFFGFLATVLVASLILKLVSTIIESKFDGTHRFTILVKGEGKQLVVSVEPVTNSVSLALISSQRNIGRFLEIPIHANVFQGNRSDIENLFKKKENLEPKDVSLFLGKLMISRYQRSDMTMLDFIRVMAASYPVPKHLLKQKEIDLLINEYEIDKISSSLFLDKIIEQENASIEVMNGTEISGLGNRLARFISNMGGVVVSVKTSDRIQETSQIIYKGKRSYTVEALYSVLPFKILKHQGEDTTLSDIRIVIGTDSTDQIPF